MNSEPLPRLQPINNWRNPSRSDTNRTYETDLRLRLQRLRRPITQMDRTMPGMRRLGDFERAADAQTYHRHRSVRHERRGF